jgi:hypothetical protein
MVAPVTNHSTFDEETFEYSPAVLGKENHGDFENHHGLRSGQGPVETLACLKCKNNKFIVGSGVYLAIIKCPDCGWT